MWKRRVGDLPRLITAGHDVIANVRKIDKRKKTGFAHTVIGAGAEKFIDCITTLMLQLGF